MVSVSGVYRTPPWGIEDQDWFFNSCAKLETVLRPKELLEECLTIEKSYKRERTLRWGPRTLDLDILLFGEVCIDEDHLTIPHPRMHERLFVMKPLNDIAPDAVIRGESPSHWINQIAETDIESVSLAREWWKKS